MAARADGPATDRALALGCPRRRAQHGFRLGQAFGRADVEPQPAMAQAPQPSSGLGLIVEALERERALWRRNKKTRMQDLHARKDERRQFMGFAPTQTAERVGEIIAAA